MGPIAAFLAKYHGRLDALLKKATAGDAGIDLEAFGGFREGLLRHIGMEETILLPALLRCRGAPVKLTDKLRLDHGALANLMMPEPSREIVSAIRHILEPHNRLEEDPGGFYEACDTLLASQAETLTQKMRSAPEVPLRPYSKRPQALEAAKRAMARAGFNWKDCI